MIRYSGGGTAEPGPALITREIAGRTWSGETEDLTNLENPSDVTGLVLFDTWTRNHDRHLSGPERTRCNLRNVFLAESTVAGKDTLHAIDQTECFHPGEQLSRRIGRIDNVRDMRVYGLFEGFRPLIRRKAAEHFAARLRAVDLGRVRNLANSIPSEWGVGGETRDALIELVMDRAAFVAGRLPTMLAELCQAPLNIEKEIED